jgi:4-hydroxybenzoate polyprenyltransferase
MYPPMNALATMLFGVTFYIAYSNLTNVKVDFSNMNIIISLFSLPLYSLILRIMDEFKDLEDDYINFPDRPLPSGRVLPKDLKVLQTILFSIAMIINIKTSALMFGNFLCIFYSYLMYKWFFVPKMMKESLPLAFVTHHPVVYVYFFYLALNFHQVYDVSTYQHLWIGIPFGLLMANWEISRKIRVPLKEDSYTTYSKIWGLGTSIGICLGIIGVITSFLMFYFYYISATSYIMITLFIVFSMIAKDYVVFKTNLNNTINLRSKAESLALFFQLFIIIEYLAL